MTVWHIEVESGGYRLSSHGPTLDEALRVIRKKLKEESQTRDKQATEMLRALEEADNA